MGLLNEAIKTYESSLNQIGKYEEGKIPLAPIGHITTSAKIQVEISERGEFLNALLLDGNEKILIPVTDDSPSRSGKAIYPHMLCDNLTYIAKDEEKIQVYLKQLKDWRDSKYTDKILDSVYLYVNKRSLLADLRNVVNLDEKSIKYLIRWVVIIDGKPIECWKSKELIEKYSLYFLENFKAEEDICMISGKMAKSIGNNRHLKGVVPKCGGNAKLISANDTSGFTYRGRFINDSEAANISFANSVKAHNALKWVSDNQSIQIGNRTFVCWKPDGTKLLRNPLDVFLGIDNLQSVPSDYRRALYRTLSGYEVQLPIKTSDVVIACFGAATTGRLSITYYNELKESDFYERLKNWDEKCFWWKRYKDKYVVCTPKLNDIVDFSFGTYRKTSNGFSADEKIKGIKLQELIQCRVDGKKIPKTYLIQLMNKVQRLGLYDLETRERLLHVTCSVLKEFYKDYYKKEIDMNIDKYKNDISFNYGRLLAISEKIERDTYKDEKREPYAIRLQSRYIQHPLHTFQNIQEQLKRAYLPKLSNGLRIFYENLISDIFENLNNCEGYYEMCDKPLKETYIIGYYLQKKELYTKKGKDESEKN